jgi:MFS family permease
LIGYLGDRHGRKTRWIAVSMGVLACGFLVMSFPHLLESRRDVSSMNTRMVDHLTLCNPNRTISVCSYSSKLRFLSDLKYVFYLSNIINACGSAALPTLAITAIEDLFPAEKAALAQGLLELKRKLERQKTLLLIQEFIMLLAVLVSASVSLPHHNF